MNGDDIKTVESLLGKLKWRLELLDESKKLLEQKLVRLEAVILKDKDVDLKARITDYFESFLASMDWRNL